MHLSSKHFAVEFRNGFSLFLSLSLISKEKKWNTTNRQFYSTASHIQTLDPLRMESGRACRRSASMSTFSWSPRTTMVRLRPRFSFAAVSSFTNGIVFGVHPANLIEATNIKKEAHEQSSKLCLKMSTLPDCTTMLILYSTRTIHNNPLWWETKEIWDGQTISEMNPRHHLHITETPTLTVVKMMTMSPLTNN